MSVYKYKITKITPILDHVLVREMDFSERVSKGGIILRSDDGKNHGIRPRWGQVYAVGPEQQDVTVGQWVCVEHGRWTRGITVDMPEGEMTLRRVDPDNILLVSDTQPADETISDKGV